MGPTGRGMRGDPSGHVVDFRSGTSNNIEWFGDGWNSEEIDALYDEGLVSSIRIVGRRSTTKSSA